MSINNIIFSFSLLFLLSTNVFSQDPQTFSPEGIYPQTPNAAAMAKFIEVPVALNTGIPSISIPLGGIKSMHSSVPLSLNYHASGNKVEEVASSVGMGWALGAGGMVSRTVQGIPDTGLPNNNVEDFYNLPSNLDAIIWSQDAIMNIKDFEPDIFNFNFSGYSGRFFIDKNAEIQIMPKQNLIIEPILGTMSGGINAWIIKTPDGKTYYFGENSDQSSTARDMVLLNETIYAQGSLSDIIQPSGYYNNWHLLEIKDVNNIDNIFFVYETYTLKNTSRTQEIKTFNGGAFQECVVPTMTANTFFNISETLTCRLKEINSSVSSVKFIHQEAPREDLLSDNALDRVEIYIGDNLLKAYQLNYQYYLSPETSSLSPVPGITYDERHKRLFLMSIESIGVEGGVLPYYNFEYNENTLLPERFSKAQDYWGFYNKEHNNATLIPRMIVPNNFHPFPTSIYFEGAERSVNVDANQALILKKIENISGGNSSFIYETNEAINNIQHVNVNPLTPNKFNWNLTSTNATFEIGPNIASSVSFKVNTDCVDPFSNSLTCFKIDIVSNTDPTQIFTIQDYNSMTMLDPGEYTIHFEDYGIDPFTELSVEVMWCEDNNNSGQNNYVLGAGLRIKTLNTNYNVKNYTYNVFGEEFTSGNILGIPTNYSYTPIMCDVSPVEIGALKFTSNSVTPLSGNDRSYVSYTNVTEHIEGHGKNLYTMDYHPDLGSPNFPSYPYEDNSYQRGNLLEQTSVNEDGLVVQKIMNNYTTINISSIQGISFDFPPQYSMNGYSTDIPIYHYFESNYNRVSLRRLLESATTITYGESGGALEQTTNYVHDQANYNLLQKIESVENYGDVTTNYLYAADISNQQMLSRNMTGISVRSKVSGLINGGSRTDYNVWAGSNTKIYPRRFYQLRTGTANSWRKTGQINSYKNTGFPNNYRRLNFPIEVYKWSAGGQLNSRKWTAQRLWEYTYDSYFNLETSKDLMNITSTFEYDEFQRLEKSISRNGAVETDYEYKYALTHDINSILAKGTINGVNYNLDEYQTFDAFGRPLTKLSRGYLSSGVGYNALGAQNSVTDANAGATQITEFDNSPLNRKKKIKWKGWDGEIQIKNEVNVTGDFGTPGTLFKEVITDENGNVSEVYSDFLGRKLLERKKMEDGSNIDTEYSYDAAGNISEITQPNGEKFIYTYDNLNRLLSKTIPGSGTHTYSGYNSNDQFSTHTDPSGQTFTYTYDVYGQIDKIETNGQILSDFTYGTSGGENGQVKSEVHAILPLGSSDTTTTNHVIDDLGRNIGMSFSSPEGTYTTSSVLDDADRIMYSSINGNGTGAAYTYEHDDYGRNYITNQWIGLDVEKINHSILGSSNDWVTQVKQGGTTVPLHTIGYEYNNRGWLTNIGACAGEPTSGGPGTGGNSSDEKENQQWGAIVVQYNTADICSQKATKLDISWNAFSGDASNPSSTTIDKSISLFGVPSSSLSLNQSETIQYQGPISAADIANQIINRMANPTGGETPSPNCLIALESEFGTYLRKVIEDELGKTPQGQDPGGPVTATIFGLALQYENPIGNATPQYNGNISSMQWCTALGENYTYEFEYDNINRITSSTGNYGNRYGTDYSYDKAGNILSIQRNGVIGELNNVFTYGLTDQLTLTYAGNRVTGVAEIGNIDYGFKGEGKDYFYDGNGNMTTAGEVTIDYTVTNMPHHFSSEDGTILVTYDAAGNKIKKETPDYVKTYYGPIEYKDGTFEAIYHEQGRTIPADGGYRTEYNIKDHLGSVRVTYSDIDGDGTIDYGSELLQENHYYPFGMVWEGTRLMPEAPNVVNPYQYNGKELNEEIGLGWLDYGARWYDPSIGRWNAVDALADHENQVDKSPYAYAWNNPVTLNDPDGNCPICPALPYIAGAIETIGAFFEAAVITTAVVTTAAVIDETIDNAKDDTNDVVVDQVDETDEDNNDEITLYRGVGVDKKAMHSLAMMGVAIPLGLDHGGHDNATRHNEGDNWSIFTSWTTQKERAREFATYAGPGGVIMSKKFKKSDTVPSPDVFNEGEVLIPGIVRGASVEIR